MALELFNHLEYRDFLRAWIKAQPNQGRGHLSRIARHLEINTTLLSQIMSGSREFTLEQALGLGDYLGLNKIELEYFLCLVQWARAGNHQLKSHWREKIEDLRATSKSLATRIKHERNLTDIEKSVFYSSWRYSAIHLLTSLKEKGVTLDEVMNRFHLARGKALEILKFLCEIGLCQETKGHYLMTTQSTFVPQGSPHLIRHHLNWRMQAMHKSEEISDRELMYTAQMSLSRKDIERLRDLAVSFIKTANEIAKPSEPEDLVNLNIDLFYI
jgi:uncharacterized protein (TIGR02147 family)